MPPRTHTPTPRPLFGPRSGSTSMTVSARKLLCVACKQAGRLRTFATMLGLSGHLRDYHGAKPDDVIYEANDDQ